MRISAESINWRVAAGEFTLIVVGILLALAIDSWAEQRKEAEQANVYLDDMAVELKTELQRLDRSLEHLQQLVDAATSLLEVLENVESPEQDPAALLLRSVGGEGITRQSAIWQEIQMTGALRLISDPELRSAIVGHYLDLAGRYNVIDANFTPAARDLRALAWDVLPIGSFQQYWQTKQSGVAAQTVLQRLRERHDTAYLLKRIILTATVARFNVESAMQSTAELLDRLE